jgi:hypothetical protein
MTEHKLPQGTLVVTKSNSEQSPDYTFMFTKDDMSEYYGKFVHAVVCEWHPLFGLDMSYFDDMLSTSPDVTVSTDCISIKYDMNINKKISTIEIKIYEKEHEGEVGLEDLLRDNKKLKKTIFEQKQRIDKLYELVLYSQVSVTDPSRTRFGVDMFYLSIRSELEEGFNLNRMLIDNPKNFYYIGENILGTPINTLHHTTSMKKIVTPSCNVKIFGLMTCPYHFKDISKRLVMLVPSLRKSKMYISGNSYRISELVLSLIVTIVSFQVRTTEKTTNLLDSGIMTYDTSLILDFFISNGLNIKEVNEDGHTILDILNDKLHKYPPHSQLHISTADAVKKILNKYF